MPLTMMPLFLLTMIMLIPPADKDDAGYLKSIHISLRNRNYKIPPNTPKYNKKNMTPNTDDPDADTPDAADYDTTYPYSLWI